MFLIQEGSKIIGYCESGFDVHMILSKKAENFDRTDLREKQLDELEENKSLTLLKIDDGCCNTVTITKLKDLKMEDWKDA